MERTPEFAPTPFTPRRWSVSGEEFTFSESEPDAASYSSVYASDLFRDRSECEARCAERNAELASENQRRLLAGRESRRKSLAFSATYWSGAVKRLEAELSAARARLSRCKQKTEIA